jgi:hypothetical protein
MVHQNWYRIRLLVLHNKLSLHLGKTKCFLFGPSRKLDKEGQFEVKCHNHVIKASDQIKYLGVTIDVFEM